MQHAVNDFNGITRTSGELIGGHEGRLNYLRARRMHLRQKVLAHSNSLSRLHNELDAIEAELRETA